MAKKQYLLSDDIGDSSTEDKQQQLNLDLKALKNKKQDYRDGVTKSQSMANNAKKLVSIPSGLDDRAKRFDQQMNNNAYQKNTEEARYNREEMKKVDQQIDDVEKQLANLKTTKTTLTKEDILRMVESSEPARMKKRDLIESISNILLREDMNDDLRRKIESGENDYSEHLDPEAVKNMADSIMNDVRANLEAKMGGRGRINLDAAQRVLANGLMGALPKEQRHKAELEQLAVSLIRQEYDIPEDAVDFDAKITGHPGMGGEEIRKTGLKMRKGTKRPPQGKTEEELKPNVTKRRLMNAMMHGAARKGQNLFHMAQDELNRIDPSLVQDYSKLMAGNDFMYWAMDDETISQESEHGAHAGQVRVDISGPRPKVIAQGMTFPFLLHELTKGVLELMSLHGLDVDKETREYVLDKTDNLESEPWDIRLGPHIWEKFLESLDIDDLPYKSHIFNRLSVLPPAEFNSLIQGLVHGSEEAKQTVREIADEVRRELNQEEVDTALGKFSDEGGAEEHPETPEGGPDDDDEDPILKGLLGNKGQEETEEEDSPENWSKSDLEDAIDAALDSGDYDTVRKLTDILNSKY